MLTRAAAMRVVRTCEESLGWVPNYSPFRTIAQARNKAADALVLLAEADPMLVTEENLRFAIAYSARKRMKIHNPTALVNRIDLGLKFALHTESVTDLDQRIRNAMDWEIARRDDQSTPWITRLTRAAGPLRSAVLDEWKAAGRG